MNVKIISEEKIHTERPFEELWLQLRLFESEHYSKQFLKEKYPEIINDELDKLSVIFSSNIKQAHEYYSAASSVSILTSPLLYYYGMLCLTNVLWSSLNKTIPIGFSHGLGRSKDSNPHLAEEYVTVHEKGASPALNSCYSEFPIKEKTKIYIKYIFSVIPELTTLFEKIYNTNSKSFKLTRSFFCLIFDDVNRDSPNLQDILKKHDDFFKQYGVRVYIDPNGKIIGFHYQEGEILNYPLQKSINGDIYCTLPINVENTLYAIPEASAHFMLMHCLGTLVRYEPGRWLQIVSGKLSSDINLISRFIEVSRRKFPNMILNGMLGKELQFTMSNIDFDDSYDQPTVIY